MWFMASLTPAAATKDEQEGVMKNIFSPRQLTCAGKM